MVNLNGLKFLKKFNIIIIHLRKKIEPNIIHIFRENPKMAIGGRSSFLENCDIFWAETN